MPAAFLSEDSIDHSLASVRAPNPISAPAVTPHATTRVVRGVPVVFWIGWGLCLLVSALVCRSLYADGAYAVLELLRAPGHYIDYDAHRSFASYVTQTPVLIGQWLGVAQVAAYAALYTAGVHALPAMLFLTALSLAVRTPMLFAATGAAIVIFGFGANFINTEANLFLALAWLAAVILVLPGRRPVLRGFVLPSLAFLSLRIYEGMLLVGPVLATAAYIASRETDDAHERIGLTFAAPCFLLAALIGFSSLVAPRDPGNAAGFMAIAFRYLSNPQVFVLGAALCSLAAITPIPARARLALTAASGAFAAVFVWQMIRTQGYYAYGLYYYNRVFLVCLLPLAIAALLGVQRVRPAWLAQPLAYGAGIAIVIPFAAVVAVDLAGSARWLTYERSFCEMLEQPPSASPVEQLKRTGAVTGWGWTHPALSILLREHGSLAMVHNDPGLWQPFDPDVPIALTYRGACENRLLANMPLSKSR
jgi:hypothetical protein